MSARFAWRVLGFAALSLAIVLFLADALDAHDRWISRGGLRNAAGEWCCGLGDCGLIDAAAVHASANGYEVHGNVTIGSGEGAVVTRVDELVPYAEAQPSPDGAYWRCKRPDGSRRCFFAPPPNT